MGKTRPCISVVLRMTTCARCVAPGSAEVRTETKSARIGSAKKLMATKVFLNILWAQIAARLYRRAGIGRHGINFCRRVALDTARVNQGEAIAHLLHLVLIF